MDVVEVHGTNVTGPFLNGYHILRRCWDDTIPAQFPLIRVLRAAPTVKSMRKEAPLSPQVISVIHSIGPPLGEDGF